MPAIKVDQVSKRFGSKTVVNNVSFEVNEGEIFGLLGPNGAGKTTLMNMMTGLLFPDRGRISILNLDTSAYIEKIRQQIALVPQTVSLYDLLTVYENLEFFGCLYHHNKTFLKTKITEMIKIFRLQEVQNIRLANLSGGYQRRCSIACALVANPRIIFLDEPLTGIDIHTNNIVINYLKSAAGITIVITTHSIKEAESLCDQIFFLDRGEKLLEGNPKEIVKKYSGLLGEQVYIEFDSSLDIEPIRRYLEKGGFNITNLKIADAILSFTILDLGSSVLKIMNSLKPLEARIVNIDIKKLSLEEVFNYIVLKNEKTTGRY